MDPFSPLLFQFSSCFAMDEDVSWMKDAGVGLENANMAMGENMNAGDTTVGKTSGKFLGDKKHKSQTRKERKRGEKSH